MNLVDRARAWLADDPDPATRRELDALLDAAGSGDEAATAELAGAFDGRLQFGTAGLRGRLGPGPNRMNVAVVARAAAGLGRYLADVGADGPVVVGFDARHRSDDFARETARVLEGLGRHALVLPAPMPTPVLAYAIRHLGAAAGVMVTASHNPPKDNGYKVYLGDGSQIVPPVDAEISARIDAVGSALALPRTDGWETLGDDVRENYVADIAALADPADPRDVTVVHTALHGVGSGVLAEVLIRAGFPAPVPVVEQREPDPDFPTVAFPNPEEAGAMDLALELAARRGADVVVASDPDADRCAVAIPSAEGWRMLSGDELGVLLGWWLLQRHPGLQGTYAASIVSGSMLEKLAADNGLSYARTLTGFKWIARVPGLAYGYEEALGYCVDPAHVADKDGVSAALLVVELVATTKARGRTVQDLLDELGRRYGVHATSQISFRVGDLSLITVAVDRLRTSPPISLGGLDVTAVEDLQDGVDGLLPTEGIRLTLGSAARVVVRPSGTEPKLKCYLEAVVAVVDDLTAARAVAAATLTDVGADLTRALALPT